MSRRILPALAALLMAGSAMAQSYSSSPGAPLVQAPGYTCYTIPLGGNQLCFLGYGGGSLSDFIGQGAIPYAGPAAVATCVGFQSCGNASTKAFMASLAWPPAALASLQALGSGTLSFTVDGVVNNSATINLSGASSMANAAALITAGFTSPNFTFTYDPTQMQFVAMSNTANHLTTSMSYATGSLSAGLLMDVGNSPGGLAASGGFIGLYNTAVGNQALTKLTTGVDNVALGELSGQALTTGGDNTLLGYQTGASLTTGVQNVLVGSGVGSDISTINGDILIGYAPTHSSSISNQLNIGNTYANSTSAPTITSGFGTSPSITGNAGSHVVVVHVGTGGTANSGVLTFPASPLGNGWACTWNDLTTTSATVFLSKQTAGSSTSVTVGNFNTSGAAAAWVAGDSLVGRCDAY